MWYFSLRRLRKEDQELEARLSYAGRLSPEKEKERKNSVCFFFSKTALDLQINLGRIIIVHSTCIIVYYIVIL
jgi:hypothetical protein